MACLLETPIRMSVLSEVTASSRHYVDRLFDPDPQKVLQGVIDMKNAVIGNNKQKANLIVLGAVPRLLYLLQQETSSTELKTECAVVLGSLAMGTENNVKSLLDCHIIPALLQGLLSPDLKFIEACLRCLRTIFTSPVTPEELLYTDATVIPHLMALLSRSRYTQEYICQIFSHCCKGPDHQTILFNHGAVQNIAHLLTSLSYKVRMQALKCFSVLAFENPQVSMTLVNVLVDGELLPQIFVKMLQRDKPIEMQLTSAKCLTYMCRAGAIRTDDNCIVLKLDHDLKHAHELRQAAFKLYASLGANDEDIRKKIIETENMMDRIVTGLSESSVKVRLAAVRCLHSLSRSVQQLRTSFQDHAVWKPLMKVLQNAPDEILVVASSMLCNLLLEFSPSKEPILESGAVELLCGLTQSENPALRVNGIWALMNMAFQAEQKIKADILRSLSTEQLFRLLSDSDLNVLMKTLGLLRNLLSTRPHIDKIMSTHGKQIMQAVTLILEGEHNIEVKEQTLCILANIADGTTAKDLIMTNDDILQKIKYYMGHSHVKLQLAAMFCISNLIWNEEEGSQERQDKLRDMGIVDILHKLSQSPDSNLCDKAKMALQQYLA
ncbi:armadillo repeat-containing protein 8 isoform X7 [Pongo pygmaeus]|uniref:Armadillo repeat-containing protein 8 n=14 Tax=Catarrhini TaxID=9526 RepID=A0A2J8TTQ7_PONAB|nr:armadillo repeat-containing protein 8 isoform 4 [Homo sapiens]XP_008007175.1 armadillo repeat-containing protein 8 isoform X6 [Chlorocebus sabaeus]XP_010361606.1 armadillo repeat-containing protein 8 isoform X6 [Rhinopithecus roxellana]XP_011719874.1 armadillo repeat-containing protein 8 isoform X6 [Macaca nemestrina]XP_011813535.1 PREDICTED: armadillo repeat-containing protein 8 isoform X4 [Colobus angolensis palliatus]XP_011837174.1 PREDICTED: armadillo repeat-containing protein 8 isoform|eukprot:NP_001253971.1 armadillo repeat-containing protein 8 isoform 4 [Homo sapiens]